VLAFVSSRPFDRPPRHLRCVWLAEQPRGQEMCVVPLIDLVIGSAKKDICGGSFFCFGVIASAFH